MREKEFFICLLVFHYLPCCLSEIKIFIFVKNSRFLEQYTDYEGCISGPEFWVPRNKAITSWVQGTSQIAIKIFPFLHTTNISSKTKKFN